MSDSVENGATNDAVAWPTVLEEAFKAEPAGWSFAATSRTPPLRFDAPGLVVTLPGGETSVAAYWFEKQQFADFSVSVTVALLSAQEPTQSYAGISFRAKSDKDNYRVFIDGEGYYRLTRRVANTSTALIDWTRHEALKAGVGEENRLRVVATGAEIILYANDVRLITVTDDTFSAGHIALQAQGGSAESDSATVFAFRNLEIASPQG
jgi:hypothetical protein